MNRLHELSLEKRDNMSVIRSKLQKGDGSAGNDQRDRGRNRDETDENVKTKPETTCLMEEHDWGE